MLPYIYYYHDNYSLYYAHIVHIQLDIYVFHAITESIPLMSDRLSLVVSSSWWSVPCTDMGYLIYLYVKYTIPK